MLVYKAITGTRTVDAAAPEDVTQVMFTEEEASFPQDTKTCVG